jgi:hypothetical protein
MRGGKQILNGQYRMSHLNNQLHRVVLLFFLPIFRLPPVLLVIKFKLH